MEEIINNLIIEMQDKVDSVSEKGDLDRHACQAIAETYIRKTAEAIRLGKEKL